MTSSIKWIFYDSMSKTQSNPLGSDEAQMAIFKMKPKDWSRFFIWTQSWSNWQPLEQFLKSEQKIFITHFATATYSEETIKHHLERDVMEMNAVDTKTQKEITKSFSGVSIDEETPNSSEPLLGKSSFNGDEMTWSGLEKPEINFKRLTEKMSFSRRSPRHELKIEVLLISPKGKTFRSTSSNISLSGSLLEDNIPFDYYGTIFDVVIVNRTAKHPVNARVTLKAKTVGDGLTQRISFHDISTNQKKMLHGLLQDYLDEQQRLTKKSG